MGGRDMERNTNYFPKKKRVASEVSKMPKPSGTKLKKVMPYSNADTTGCFGWIKTLTLLSIGYRAIIASAWPSSPVT